MSNPVIPFVDPAFMRSANRRSLKYAIQVRDEKLKRVVKCLTVSVDISGGMPPPAIKRRLTEKVLNFVANAYPGQLGITAIIVGRVDVEI